MLDYCLLDLCNVGTMVFKLAQQGNFEETSEDETIVPESHVHFSSVSKKLRKKFREFRMNASVPAIDYATMPSSFYTMITIVLPAHREQIFCR